MLISIDTSLTFGVMNEFAAFFQLGIRHILDPQGYDHMLYILVLVAPFLLFQWKQILGLVTAFTLGHALTLVLSMTGHVLVNTSWVELGIALSILVTALFQWKGRTSAPMFYIYLATLGFGLIHGLGFAAYLKSLMGVGSGIFVPLLAFNLGVEGGQVIFVLVMVFAKELLLKMGVKNNWWVALTCLLAIVASLLMIFDRI